MAGNSSESSVNYYAVLGVSRNASAEEIRAAYLKLAMKSHPDKVGKEDEDASARFQDIQQAYKVLSCPTRRAMYDGGMYNAELENTEPDYVDVLAEMMAMTTDEEEERLIAGIEAIGFLMEQQQEEPIRIETEGIISSSSSPPVLRVDVNFTNDGTGSPTAAAGASVGRGTRSGWRRLGPFCSRRRRLVTSPAPILRATTLKFE